MRYIQDHKLNGLNDSLSVAAIDEPSPQGGNHEYAISWSYPTDSTWHSQVTVTIKFQNGPLRESVPNGISNEALIAIVIDRLMGFQHGPERDPNKRGEYACKENAVALTDLQSALMWLQKRTRDRMARGVEGTMAK